MWFSVLYFDTKIKWHGAHFIFISFVPVTHQADARLLPSSPLVQPLVPHLHFFVSTVCQLWDTVMTHLSVTSKMPDKQRQPESPSLSPRSESQCGAGGLVQKPRQSALSAPLVPSAVGSFLDYRYIFVQLIDTDCQREVVFLFLICTQMQHFDRLL